MLNITKLALTLSLVAAACGKSDSKPAAPTGTAEGQTATTDQPSSPSSAPRRSGKIDLPNLRRGPALPEDGEAERPRRDRKDWADPAKREEMKERFDDMRKAREAKLDTDGDGKISEPERVKARHERADKMRTRMDANGDGKVSAEELTSDSGGRFTRRLGDPATIDTNKDGDISTDELDAALGSRGDRRGRRGSDGSVGPDGSASDE